MAASFDDLREQAESSIKKLGALAPQLDNPNVLADGIKALNSEATRFVRDADSALRKMEAEAKAAGPSQRREMVEKIASTKAAMQAARASVQRANDGKARAALLKTSDKSAAIDMEARDKLESAAEKSSVSTQRLQAAQQVLSETQDIGVGVMDTMTQQREVLLRATAKAGNTTTLAGRARGIMRLMQARAITNKALLVLTILILLGVIGVVVYFGFFAPNAPKKGST